MRLAQLDRASDYGSEGREFESSIARQKRLQIAISFLLPIQTSDAMIQTEQDVGGKSPRRIHASNKPKSVPAFLFCKLLYLRCDQCLIFKVVDLHGCLYFFQGLCSNCFCFLTSGLQNFINCRNILLPLFSAVTDRL